jgi:hypothetical protein
MLRVVKSLAVGFLSLYLISCGSGGDSVSSDTNPAVDSSDTNPAVDSSDTNPAVDSSDNQGALLKGVFIDSPTENLFYKTLTQSGYTNSLGEFYYLSDEIVEFYIGELSLGSSHGNKVITPFDFLTNNSDPDYAQNILRLLQTLDEDGVPDNGIQLSDETIQKTNIYKDDIDFNLPSTEFESQEGVTNLMVETSNTTLVSTSDAFTHFWGSINTFNSNTGFSEDTTSIEGQKYLGHYGDFLVYEVLSDTPDDVQSLVSYSDTLLKVTEQIIGYIITIPGPAYLNVPAWIEMSITLLQDYGVYPSVTMKLLTNDGIVKSDVIAQDERVIPLIFLKTGNEIFTNPGSIQLFIKGSTSNYTDVTGSFIFDEPFGIAYHNDLYDYLSDNTPFSYANFSKLESHLVSVLEPNKVYLFIPSGGRVSNLHNNLGIEDPVNGKYLFNGDGILYYNHDSTIGISFDDVGRYKMSVSLPLFSSLLVNDGSVIAEVASPRPYVVGDTGPSGGIVFYVDGTGMHGLEAAPTDLEVGDGVPWGCNNTLVRANYLGNGYGHQRALGTGALNTINIINQCTTPGIAARLVSDYIFNDFNDWYLPSKDEMKELIINENVFTNLNSLWYWTSTQVSSMDGFYPTEVGVTRQTYIRSVLNANVLGNVRPVRTF